MSEKPGPPLDRILANKPTDISEPLDIASGFDVVRQVQEMHPGCVVILKDSLSGVTIRGDLHPTTNLRRIRAKASKQNLP